MAVEYHLLTEGGEAGSYWASLSTIERSRYGTSGAYRVHSSYSGANSSLMAMADDFSKEVVLECAGNWETTTASTITWGLKFYSLTITSKINGVFGSGFHGGVNGAGIVFRNTGTKYRTLVAVSAVNFLIEGIQLKHDALDGGYCLNLSSPFSSASSLIVTGFTGILVSRDAVTTDNCIFDGCIGDGINLGSYQGKGQHHYNHLAVNCGTGFTSGTSCVASLYNSIAYNNTTNWGTAPTGGQTANNFGETGDVPWGSSPTTGVGLADFVDFALKNYRPAAGSIFINGGVYYRDSLPRDMIGNVRPNYEPSTYPNNLWDAGPFEYDHGNGLAPQTVTISITGIAEGSVLAMYNSSTDTEIIAPTTIGATGEYSDTTFEYTADVPVAIYVRKSSSGTKYKPWKGLGTITSSGLNVVVSQAEDTVAI